MKILVQRVTSASVTVDGKVISSIGKGICVLLGISRKDTSQELEWTARKLLNLRIFQDPGTNKQWEKSVVDLGLEILCVSQFTLCHVLKGNKPDFHNAMKAEHSSEMYCEFLTLLGSNYNPDLIKGGEFGAYMNVHIENDGPVTLDIESPSFPPPKERKPQGSSTSQEKAKATEEHKQTDDS